MKYKKTPGAFIRSFMVNVDTAHLYLVDVLLIYFLYFHT